MMSTQPHLTREAPPEPRPALPLSTHMTVRLLLVVLAIALLALFGRIMSYPLQHDEQYYVPAGVLFSWSGLYEQLGFSHLPNWALLLHSFYSLPVDQHYLLVGRLLICAAWIGAVTATIALGRLFSADRLTLALMVALLVTNPLLLGPTGMAATNNFVAVPFLLFGLYSFIRGFRGDGAGWAALAGLLLAAAAGFKANYTLLLIPFAIAALTSTRGLPWRDRALRYWAPFVAGGVLGALPTLFFLLRPQSLAAHVLAFQRGPQISYWLAHPDPADPKIMSLRGKLILAEQTWMTGGTMVLVMALVTLGICVLGWRSGRAEAWSRSPFLPLLGGLLVIAALVAFIPTPAFPQYFALPIPLGIIVLAALAQQLEERWRPIVQPVAGAALALALLAGAPMLLSAPTALLQPRKWAGIQVHKDAKALAAMLPAPSTASPVATLAPLYPLEGGQRVLPQLALGPFIYRALDYTPPAARRYFADPISPGNVDTRLRRICPQAVLVGWEKGLDEGFLAFARDAGYAPHPFTLRGPQPEQVVLLTRPATAACAAGASVR